MAAGISRAEMIEKLEAHGFPSYYNFKFIVPIAGVASVLAVLPEGEVAERPSRNGNYISISCKAYLNKAEEAVDVYERAHGIEGIIAL